MSQYMYIENFETIKSVIEDYEAPEDALDGAVVHLAWYGYGDYCGQSLVIFERDGQLYEVNGSHCSCYGLEGQWEPKETSWEALSMRDIRGDYDGSLRANEALHELVEKHRGRRFFIPTVTGRQFKGEE